MAPITDSNASARIESRWRPPDSTSEWLMRTNRPRPIRSARRDRIALETSSDFVFVSCPSCSSGWRRYRNSLVTSPRTESPRNSSRSLDSAVWFDYDRDGKLDLFLGGYYAEDVDLWHLKNTRMMPESFEYAKNGGRKYLFHNLGDGTFEEVSQK